MSRIRRTKLAAVAFALLGCAGQTSLSATGGDSAGLPPRGAYGEDACNAGDLEACVELAEFYGPDSEAWDVGRATRFYSRACDGGVAESCARLASLYETHMVDHQHAKEALELDAVACEGGHGAACERVADAVREACDGGAAKSCTRLGALYEGGKGLSADVTQAVELYAKACDAGDEDGCARLGPLLSDAVGRLAAEPERAADLYGKACRGGHTESCQRAGELIYALFSTGASFPKWKGLKRTRVAEVLRLACDGGHGASCYYLGLHYDLFETRNEQLDLYLRGCETGYARSCTAAGRRYFDGQRSFSPVAQDLPRFAELSSKGCDGGDVGGCENLAWAYAEGSGVAKDDARAVELFSKACDGGHSRACQTLGRRYERGDGVTRDRARAVALYEKGCKTGPSVVDGGYGCDDVKRLEQPASGRPSAAGLPPPARSPDKPDRVE